MVFSWFVSDELFTILHVTFCRRGDSDFIYSCRLSLKNQCLSRPQIQLLTSKDNGGLDRVFVSG